VTATIVEVQSVSSDQRISAALRALGLVLFGALLISGTAYAASGANMPGTAPGTRPSIKQDARIVPAADLELQVAGPQGSKAVIVTVTNKGLAPAGAFVIAYTCQRWVDKAFMENCSMPSKSVGGLAPGKSTVATLAESLFTHGYFYSLGIYADKNNQVKESNESNNFKSKQLKF